MNRIICAEVDVVPPAMLHENAMPDTHFPGGNMGELISSNYALFRFAWAAASRAIGTRNGEQET